MSGKQLKDILDSMGCANVSELARMLGMKSAQNLHAALDVQDVKTGLVEDLARILNKPIAEFFPDGGAATATDHSIAVNGSKNAVNTISERFIGLLEKKDEQLDRMLGIIESLK